MISGKGIKPAYFVFKDSFRNFSFLTFRLFYILILLHDYYQGRLRDSLNNTFYFDSIFLKAMNDKNVELRDQGEELDFLKVAMYFGHCYKFAIWEIVIKLHLYLTIVCNWC